MEKHLKYAKSKKTFKITYYEGYVTSNGVSKNAFAFEPFNVCKNEMFEKNFEVFSCVDCNYIKNSKSKNIFLYI